MPGKNPCSELENQIEALKRELHQYRQIVRALRELEFIHHIILDALQDAIYVLDSDLRFVLL